jgi:hypothetical protein
MKFDQPVTYATHFYASGWGIRPLEADELGTALGLPARLRDQSLTLDELIFTPVQILDGVLDGFMETLVIPTITERAAIWIIPPSALEQPDLTWLPEIKRFMTSN